MSCFLPYWRRGGGGVQLPDQSLSTDAREPPVGKKPCPTDQSRTHPSPINSQTLLPDKKSPPTDVYVPPARKSLSPTNLGRSQSGPIDPQNFRQIHAQISTTGPQGSVAVVLGPARRCHRSPGLVGRFPRFSRALPVLFNSRFHL
jgi:hypothetical protein